MALLDNMYAPYSHLMRYHHHQSVAESNRNTTPDPSITRLDINVSGSSESSPTSGSGGNTHVPPPPSTKLSGPPTAHYGGVISTMNLKLEPNNFRGFPTISESPGQENNINGENRREQHSKVQRFFYIALLFIKNHQQNSKRPEYLLLSISCDLVPKSSRNAYRQMFKRKSYSHSFQFCNQLLNFH